MSKSSPVGVRVFQGAPFTLELILYSFSASTRLRLRREIRPRCMSCVQSAFASSLIGTSVACPRLKCQVSVTRWQFFRCVVLVRCYVPARAFQWHANAGFQHSRLETRRGYRCSCSGWEVEVWSVKTKVEYHHFKYKGFGVKGANFY